MTLNAQFVASWDGLSRAQFVPDWLESSTAIAPPTLTATRAHARNITRGIDYYVKNANFTDTIPASITKLTTIYVLLQYKTEAELLTETATLQASDGPSGGLLTGDVLTLHALVAAALLPSNNSAAKAIARVVGQHIIDTGGGGTVPVTRFLQEMNTRAAAIGMSSSTYYNASGLENTPENASSPTDCNTVAGLLWGYATMRALWTYQTYYLPIVRGGTPTTISITSSNQMFTDTGVVGGKTGTTGSTANLSILWRAPNDDIVALTVFKSGELARYTGVRAMIAALPGDFPELAQAVPTITSITASNITQTGARITLGLTR